MSNVLVLYRPNTDQDPVVRTFTYDYERQTGKKLHSLSLDTIEGDESAKMYGITAYPAVIARDNEGKALKIWQTKLPLINEVSYYDQPE